MSTPISVEEAKRRLLDYGQEVDARRRAKGPMGTLKGKALVGGAVAAVVIGLLVAGPVMRLVARPKPTPPPFPKWWRKQAQKEDVKKAAVGGLSLAVLVPLIKPLVPHLMNFATQKYMQHRIAKAAAAAAAGGSGMGSAPNGRADIR